MSVADLLANVCSYAAEFDKGALAARPEKKVAIVACMDARLNIYGLFGLIEGDAHVIRNAGGVVTDDVMRSLVVSQRVLGTEEIIVVHHTDCGMLKMNEARLSDEILNETGSRPECSFRAFDDVDEDVRRSVATISTSSLLPRTDVVLGFVYDVESGHLRSVV